VTGIEAVGRTLSCSTGTWSGSPTYAYQWKRDGATIGGATSSTYLLDALDEATLVKCRVTATNVTGSASADSNEVGPVAEDPGVLFYPTTTDYPSSSTYPVTAP
jgi:hypothetical protein